MKLNFRQLEVFRAIMIAKTVSGAADLLHVSQPGISRLLKYTEYKLGVNLFERRKGKLIPTPEGEELYRELVPIYEQIEGLETTIDRITRLNDLQLSVGCTPSLARYVLPVLLSKAKKKVPDMQIKVDIMSNEELSDYIANRKGDFGLSLYPIDHPLVLSESSIESRLVCVVPKDHELASRQSVEMEDVVKHRLVMYQPQTLLGKMLNKKLNELDLSPQMSVMVQYNDDACAMVQHGLGITIATDFSLMGNRYPTLTTVPISGDKLIVHTVRNNTVSFSHNVNIFYDNFKSELDKLKFSE